MAGMDHELGPALLARLRAHDADAFDELVKCCERPMFNVAYRMLGNVAEAADATQCVFLKVFEHLDGFDARYRLFSWIYRIAVNESLDRLQRHRRTDAVPERVEDLPLVSGECGPEELVRNEQMHDVIQAALMELQYDYRMVIVLRHFSECSYGQMADILHIPEKTVKSRLYSARQLLREKLSMQGVTRA